MKQLDQGQKGVHAIARKPAMAGDKVCARDLFGND